MESIKTNLYLYLLKKIIRTHAKSKKKTKLEVKIYQIGLGDRGQPLKEMKITINLDPMPPASKQILYSVTAMEDL